MIPNLLLSYYGDDFTGSTDVMEALTVGGVPTVLFLEPPTPERLARFPDVRALGMAGISRSQSPHWMDENLPAIFRNLKTFKASLCHYKVCSTFDSAAHVGSIGRALDIGAKEFGATQTPIVVGAPGLRRYQAFGNLFATVDDIGYRIDRHPTMKHHPVTPMEEADLRQHLSKQTHKSMGLIDILSLWSDDYRNRHDAIRQSDSEILFYDVMEKQSLGRVGELLWTNVTSGNYPFCVGSSGIEYALINHWQNTASVPLCPPSEQAIGATDRVFVMSGSCSPVTAGQIQWAVDSGFTGLHMDIDRINDPATRELAIEETIEKCCRHLNSGQSTIAYSAIGAPDNNQSSQLDSTELSRRIGTAQGHIFKETLRRTGVKRAIVAGGDTSGHVMQQIEAFALTWRAPAAPGSPLCTVHSDVSDFTDLQIVLKGGQVGQRDFFERVRAGH